MSAGLISLGVIGARELLDASSLLAIALGGGFGCGVVHVIFRLGFLDDRDRIGRGTQSSIVGPRWFAFWLVALCALRFLADLSWIESTCSLATLIAFFLGAERIHGRRRSQGYIESGENEDHELS